MVELKLVLPNWRLTLQINWIRLHWLNRTIINKMESRILSRVQISKYHYFTIFNNKNRVKTFKIIAIQVIMIKINSKLYRHRRIKPKNTKPLISHHTIFSQCNNKPSIVIKTKIMKIIRKMLFKTLKFHSRMIPYFLSTKTSERILTIAR